MNWKRIITVLLIAFLFSINSVFAKESECTSTSLANLKTLAYNITFTYDIYSDSKIEDNYFYLTLDNVNKDFIVISNNGYEGETLTGKIEKMGKFYPGSTYYFKIYTTLKSECPAVLLYTKYITFPWYNPYSSHESCIGIEDYSLCKKWRKPVDYTEEEFVKKINEYKESLKPSTEEKKDTKEQISVIKFLQDNPLIFIASIILLISIIAFIIYKLIQNKKKIKIKI